MAGELGFEPRLAESESAVLPLDDSPKKDKNNQNRTLPGSLSDLGYSTTKNHRRIIQQLINGV